MKKTLTLVIIFLFISCDTRIETRKNNPDDIKDAESKVTELYQLFDKQDSIGLRKHIPDSMYIKFIETLKKIKYKEGNMLNAKNTSIYTEVTIKNKELPFKYYEYHIDVTYEKGRTREDIIIEGDEKNLKISHFNLREIE